MYISKRLGLETGYLFIPTLVVFMISVLMNPVAVTEGIKNGLNACYNILIPSLFLFIFLSKLLYAVINSTKLGASGASKTVMLIIFGFTGGFPVGASILSEMVKNKEMTPESASGWLCGLVNPGPAFVIAAVGAGMLSSPLLGVMIYSALCAASVVCLLLYAKGNLKTANLIAARFDLSEVMASSVNSMIGLCGCVVLFSGILNLVLNKADSYMMKIFLAMVTEVTSGVAYSARYGGNSTPYYVAAAISICGISTIAQVLQVLSDTGVSIKKFMLSRLIHLPISLLVLHVEMLLMPNVSAEVFAVANRSAELFCLSPEFSLFAFMAVGVLLFGEKSLRLFTGKKKMV